VVQILHTELLVFVSDGGAENPTGAASFGWVLSTIHGQQVIHASRPACGTHSDLFRAKGHGILSAMQFVCLMQSFVTGQVRESIMVDLAHQALEECAVPCTTLGRLLIMMCWLKSGTLVTQLIPLHPKGHHNRKTEGRRLDLQVQFDADTKTS